MRIIAALLISLACVTSVVDAAENLIMFRFKSVGVEEELVDATMMLFEGALGEEGKYHAVSAVDVVGDVECYEPMCAAEFGREAGYAKAIIGSLTRLGYKIIARVQLVETRDGAVLYSEDGVSEEEEDLDMVLARLAKSVTTGKKFEETAEVGPVTRGWLTVGLGPGYWSPNNEGGAAILAEAAFQRNKHLFSTRLFVGGDINIEGGSKDEVAELGFLYGRATRGGSAAASAGIGITEDAGIGLAISAQAFAELWVIGIGLYVGANINGRGLLAGLTLALRFGKLW